MTKENAEAFSTLRCENRPPEYGSHRPLVGAGRSDRSSQAEFEFATIDARISSALQTGREAKGYCGCRFLQRRAKKREALLSLFQATGVAIFPSRNHEADTVAFCFAAALTQKKPAEHYKFNSTPRSKYAGYTPIKHKKAQ